MDMRLPTDNDMDTLPQIILTSDLDWSPSSIDFEHDPESWFDNMSELPELEPPAPFDEIGELRESNIVCLRTADPPPDEFYACFKSHIDFHNELIVDARELMEATKREREVKESPIDYEALQPMFGWLPIDVIRNTFTQTTQFYRTPASTHLK